MSPTPPSGKAAQPVSAKPADPITIEYRASWRRRIWDEDVPSRPAWLVSCTEHPDLGKDSDGEPWGYASRGRASGVATRHRRTRHSPSAPGGAGEKEVRDV